MCIFTSPTPVKSTREGGVRSQKCTFYVFLPRVPQGKFYTPRNVRGGGSKMDGVDKGSSNPLPSLIHFAHVLEFLGFLGVLNP